MRNPKTLKLVSVRLDPCTLSKIDDFCRTHSYWKRNAVINGILMAATSRFDDGQLYDMVRSNYFPDVPMNVRFNFEDENPNGIVSNPNISEL